ncbi:prenyltransferase/squalene oxidase repeat-containing protein [Tuwongella immobilis]|uniref:Squalene cyclase C-terminal domain-containing protein n=1 Tax=Tuwongella immobilis TaxID=692036 RepID=A0A6C2YN13_9BACT|nr:squalene--hopene cyclase [Tuwongella immobilis]VIP02513.1 Squalene-hopene cyclase OS=Rhodopirellula europaea SH398 GN=RESH_02251 PE=4 SV=1: Prenyltrans_1 [Tuwongella immobilis]VTS01628.1 Squalene-hopene cyclase OS=Rhodopirellula europaea SH398 GN=RESH_02251 PE=4 SV=1: Prenyltrans_1 [Tuwongella immobilis]
MKPFLLALSGLLLGASIAAADTPQSVPPSAPNQPTEPLAKSFSWSAARSFLDTVNRNWTDNRQCLACHTNLYYMHARPLLEQADSEAHRSIREFLEDRAQHWDTAKPRWDAEVLTTAFALAGNDAASTGKLHAATKSALDRMWKLQTADGGFNWLKCAWPPMEHDDYYGATIAAVATAIAPEDYAKSPAAQAGLAKLRTYFAKNPAPDLHHRTMLLWASAKLEGLLTEREKQATIAELRKVQRADGGWSLPALGTYKRRDGSANDPTAPSDGYATGLAVMVLRQAGVAANDPGIQRGAAWLKANQRESGRWFTRSLNNDKAHLIANAGSSLAVMALKAVEGK